MEGPWLLVLHGLGTPLTVLLYARLALPGRSALAAARSALQALATTRGGRRVLFAALALAGANFVESPLDPAISAALGYDLTPWVARAEGALVERIQLATPEWMGVPLALAYLPGWLALLLAPGIVQHARGRALAIAEHVAGIWLNYLLALPFYLFFPVREVAFSGRSAARPWLEDFFPAISADMRVGSALDNCFPSLHVSLVVTALAVAARHGPGRLAALAALVLALTIWSVTALGIHWGLDVLSAIPFGLGCAWLGARLAPRFVPARP
jgi:membrane-associated phospholipid phosphatase